MSRYGHEGPTIDYTDVEALKAALVGRSIIATVETPGTDYDGDTRFILDDGSALIAHEQHGGCACSNGCFSVRPVSNPVGTITNVEIGEFEKNWDYSTRDTEEKQIEPGSLSDGSAVIRIFVYTDLGKQTLVESEGGDNGYYGWGFWLHVEAPPAKGEVESA